MMNLLDSPWLYWSAFAVAAVVFAAVPLVSWLEARQARRDREFWQEWVRRAQR